MISSHGEVELYKLGFCEGAPLEDLEVPFRGNGRTAKAKREGDRVYSALKILETGFFW
jgi:hypothetical protein